MNDLGFSFHAEVLQISAKNRNAPAVLKAHQRRFASRRLHQPLKAQSLIRYDISKMSLLYVPTVQFIVKSQQTHCVICKDNRVQRHYRHLRASSAPKSLALVTCTWSPVLKIRESPCCDAAASSPPAAAASQLSRLISGIMTIGIEAVQSELGDVFTL